MAAGPYSPASEKVSNLLSSPASGEFWRLAQILEPVLSFQFIEFPSEWGEHKFGAWGSGFDVSNLLSSPASGEEVCYDTNRL